MLQYLENLFYALDFSSIGSLLLHAAAIFLCLSVHETCHGLAAYALGDPTAKSMRRLSLNPLRHIDPIGLVMMFAAGFGWAKPVPVNPLYFRRPKLGMAVTALAGPVSNLILAVLAVAISRCIYAWAPVTPFWDTLFSFFAQTVAPLSIGLGLFNLLPIPPLDGSKILAVVLPDRAYAWLMRYERYGFLVLLAISYFGIVDGFIGRAILTVFAALVNFFF